MEEESTKQKTITLMGLWFGVIGVPLGIILTVLLAFGVAISVALPISILTAIISGLTTNDFILRGEIKDLRKKIKRLKNNRNYLIRRTKNVKE